MNKERTFKRQRFPADLFPKDVLPKDGDETKEMTLFGWVYAYAQWDCFEDFLSTEDAVESCNAFYRCRDALKQYLPARVKRRLDHNPPSRCFVLAVECIKMDTKKDFNQILTVILCQVPLDKLDIEVCVVLLEGARAEKISLRDGDGDTQLHYAVMHRTINVEWIKLLLLYKDVVDPNALNNLNFTALDLAYAAERPDVVAILFRAMKFSSILSMGVNKGVHLTGVAFQA